MLGRIVGPSNLRNCFDRIVTQKHQTTPDSGGVHRGRQIMTSGADSRLIIAVNRFKKFKEQTTENLRCHCVAVLWLAALWRCWR
jgi:hypothetical protein